MCNCLLPVGEAGRSFYRERDIVTAPGKLGARAAELPRQPSGTRTEYDQDHARLEAEPGARTDDELHALLQPTIAQLTKTLTAWACWPRTWGTPNGPSRMPAMRRHVRCGHCGLRSSLFASLSGPTLSRGC